MQVLKDRKLLSAEADIQDPDPTTKADRDKFNLTGDDLKALLQQWKHESGYHLKDEKVPDEFKPKYIEWVSSLLPKKFRMKKFKPSLYR